MRPTRAEVDLAAVTHNVGLLHHHVAPAGVCAVVKANGYGHGAVPVAEAALAGGAGWLAVALVSEAAELRDAGIDVPVLVLAEPTDEDWAAALAAEVAVGLYQRSSIEAFATAAARRGVAGRVHLKVDTGMRRVGAEPTDIVGLAQLVDQSPWLELEAIWTHCAVADEPGNPTTDRQLDALDAVLDDLDRAGLRPPLVHAANSAAAIDHPRSRRDLVRCGIAVYGIAPAPALADRLPLRPAMHLRSEVSMVKRVPAGEGVSYGHRYVTPCDTVLATVPVGYADGVPRRLGMVGGKALVGGRRVPIAGMVTMDQLVVDCGPDAAVQRGDEVVLLGAQGDERIGPDEWAALTDTIAYEIVCGISPRVPRVYGGA
ncbi:MAG: alanine racemase [Acidimicrobiia bacterium]|nr:alanine racemase [Acidimicrobiia bacterium]